MRIEENVSLAKYTTFRMGGMAKKLIVPETEEELVDVVRNRKLPRYLIGGGSNLLINDEREFDEVILLSEFGTAIVALGDGKFYSGASVRLQKLIKTINDAGYGGIEYLFSVPGLVGGAIVMNAGKGNSIDEIGKYVLSVRAIVDGEICEIEKNSCNFSRRNSIFKNSDIVVLGATFQFIEGDPICFKEARAKRIAHVKEVQDNSHPNFGTVFYKSDSKIMRMVSKLSRNDSGVYYSKKTTNWLLNNNGTFEQAISEIDRVKRYHKLLRRQCEPEVTVWR